MYTSSTSSSCREHFSGSPDITARLCEKPARTHIHCHGKRVDDLVLERNNSGLEIANRSLYYILVVQEYLKITPEHDIGNDLGPY